MMVSKWEGFREKAGKLFNKSKMKTEEALQITQLNQKLRSLRSEREEGIRKIGEEAFSLWKDEENDLKNLEEICLAVEKKEAEITRTEQEKEKVRQAFSEKIREVEEKEIIIENGDGQEGEEELIEDKEKQTGKEE